MKRYIYLMVALLSAVGMKAQQQIGDFWYYLNEWDLTASLYIDNPSVTYDDEVSIPSTVEYDNKVYSVNKIDRWYYPNKRVSLVLPSTMTTVNLSWFQSEIGTLTIPSTASIEINDNNNIEDFALSGDHAKYSVEDGVLFDKGQTTLLAYPRLKDRTSYTVPSTVTVIGRNAFSRHDKLEYLTLPEGLLEIQESAMSGMYRLNSCNIPSKLKIIGNNAFNGCQLVFAENTLTLPRTLTSIGYNALNNAFKYWSSTTVVLPRELGSDLDGGTNLYIGEYAIQCNSIKSEILKPINVHWNAFSNVQAIFIPEGTKDLYLQKEGWNYDNGSKLRGGGVSYDETVAAVAITDLLDYDNRTVSAKLSTKTEGAEIRYKITTDINDNSDPTKWDVYDDDIISMVSNSGEYSWQTYYLRAIAFKDGMNTSAIATKTYHYSDYVCSRPTINCIDNSTTLTISTPDADAIIYYTTDGSDPVASESATCFKYTGTITLTKNATYRAIAAREGKFPSDISDAKYVTWFPVEPIVAEQVLVDGQPCLKLATATEGAEIWYSYNWYYEEYRYDKPIPASRNQTIYFIGKKDGFNSTSWNTYRMNYDDYTLCESPSVEMNNETRQVTLSTTEADADIWYLIDKDNNPNNYPMPNTNNGSIKYDGKPFRPWTNGQLKVIVAKDGKVNSDVYQTNLDEVFRLRNVDFVPVLGEEENEFRLGFSYPETGINGIKIYYYFSGIDWTEYTGTPINVPANADVYARARAEGYVESDESYFYVSSDRYMVSQPRITAISQDKKLRITCDTKGATIYYTTDGTDPTTESPNHFEINEYYTPDIDVPLNGTYKFMAAKEGMYNSTIATIVISDWYRVPRVNIIPFAKDGKMMVKLTCKDEWKYKYYWAYDGNVNYDVITTNSEYTMYQDMEIEADRKIYFTAYLDGYQTNWVSTWVGRGNFTCSTPYITVNADTLVNMTTNTVGATIKYTLDGNDPSTSWTAKEYTEPFKIDKNYTIKAVAIKDSMFNSGIQTNNYSNFRVANIEFEQIVDEGQPKMKMTSSTPGVTIRYSFNGWDLENSKVYAEPIAMSRGQWVYAIAQKDGYNDTGWQEKSMDYSSYTDFCASAGINSDWNSRTVTLSTSEPGGEIYYVIDTDGNTNPTRKSTKYDGKPFRPSVYGRLKTIVFAEGKICSDISNYGLEDVFRLREVTFEPQYEAEEDVYKMHFSYRDTTIANVSDVEIYYWNEGEEQKKYDGTPITCTIGNYLYAYAHKPGYVDSWQRNTYVSKDIYRLHQPNVNTRSESKTLVVTWDDEDAKVYWTDNGEDPNASNGKSLDKYYHPDIVLTHNGTYKFVAVKDKMFSSPITTVTINDWFRVPDVKIIPFGENDKFMVKLECEGYNNIYWAYDDELAMDAVIGNTPYTAPFEVTEGKRIYATAWKDGYNENWVSSDWLYRNNYTCTIPTIAVNRDTVVTITNNQTGAKIRYTLDGSDPTIYTGTEYTEPFKLLNNATIKAIAYKDSLLTSSVRSHQYTGYRVAEVKISTFIENNQIMAKLETKTPDAKIYYNFNERNNTVTSNLLYTEPFVVADGYRVQANAVKDGYTEAGWTSTDWFNYSSYTASQPIITILPDTTVFMSADTGAEIRYTLDGTTPTVKSSKYTTTIKLTRNSQIRAIAVMAGKINSPVSEYNYEEFRVKDVNFSFFAQDNNLMAELTCDDKNATIYYKIGDGYNAQDITASPNVKYTGPFAVAENRRIWASAVKDGYNNASWRYAEGITKAAYTATMPDIGTDENGKISIIGEKDAKFYYTNDNTTPTTSSTLYTAPFAVTQNDTIKAIAVVDRKFNSSVATYYYNGYSVNRVTITPIVEDNILKVSLTTTTPNATIYYGINEHNEKASANIRYTTPFTIKNGDRVFASATRNGYQDAAWSECSEIYFSDYTCNAPIISIDGEANVSIGSDAGATIYYSLDGSIPTSSSTQYSNSFQLTRNTTIKAIAIKEGMMKSEVREMTYNEFRVANPVFAQDGTTMTITTTTPEATIYYAYESEGNTVNKNSHKYAGPFDVMDNSTILAYAVREGWYDSDVTSINTGDKITCPMVEAVSYDGHFLTLKAIDDATIWYTTNGNDPRDNSNKSVSWIYEYKTPIAINSTGQIKAIATKRYMNSSEIATFDINFYAGENGTTLEKPGVLEEVMAWSDVTTITEFNIEGPLNQADLAFIKEHMTSLQHLDMSKTTIEDGTLPDNAFSGLPIISFTSPENITQVGNGIFTNCPELAAVRWNTTTKLPDNAFDANHNPNLLLFVRFEIAAPSHAAVENQIINGTAQSIVLVDDYTSNFYCPEKFYAKSIKYTHKFTMTSGNGGGWESFSLPFTPTRFIHESKGELLPFKSYEQQENQEAYRPFWLRSLNELGFEDVSTMEANKPYIICMPNNERYATRFRLAGNVTFSATDTYVPITDPEPSEKGNVMLVPNFLHRDKEVGILAVNLETEGEFLPGSAFLDNVRGLRPFEAYARSIGVPRQAIRINDDDLMLATAIQDTQLIDVSGNAIIKVYNLSGNLVITGKRSEVMSKLADGVYIIDGKKIVVK